MNLFVVAGDLGFANSPLISQLAFKQSENGSKTGRTSTLTQRDSVMAMMRQET